MSEEGERGYAARCAGKGDADVSMLKSLVGEQAAQLKVLTELGHHLVRAHFAFRQRHSDLSEKHEVLVNTLCSKGVVSSQDLLLQVRASRSAKLLAGICSDQHLAGTLVLTSGVPTARRLLVAAPRFASGLGFALEQFEEAARYFVQLVARCEEQGMGELGESALAEGASDELARDGFLVLLQEVWQCNTLSESISCSMGLSALKQFRAVSRAGRECMRSVMRSVDSRSKRTQQLLPAKEMPPEPPEAVRQTLALLQHLWQDIAFAETLKNCMGSASVRAFRAISRGGRECMRSATKWHGGRKAAGEQQALVPAQQDLSDWGSCSSGEGRRLKKEQQASQLLMHAPDNFLLFMGSTAQDTDGGDSKGKARKRLVRLHDLTQCSNLNGVLGQVTVKGALPRDRWPVRLPSGETIKVRPQHCQLLARAPDGELVPIKPKMHELMWAPRTVQRGASAQVRVFTARVPARIVAKCLRPPSIGNLVMASAYIKNTLAVTGKLYVCGGVDQTKVLSSVECFDLYKQRWVDPPPNHMTRPRGGAAYCLSGGHFYCAGGSDWTNGWLNTLERFDPWSGEWQAMPPMKTPRIYAAMVSIHGFLYVCGGHTHNNVPVSAAERFDPIHRTWKELPSMLERRTAPMACVVDNRLFVVGGVDRDYVRELEVYDPRAEVWHRLPPMSEARTHAGFTMADACLYICGGQGRDKSGAGRSRGHRGSTVRLQTAERFLIDRLSWTDLPKMKCPRSHASSVVRGDVLFCCGGCFSGQASTEALDLTSMAAWEQVGTPLIQEWTLGVVISLAEHIYVLGGRSKREPRRSALRTTSATPGAHHSRRDREQHSEGLLNSMVRYNMSSNVWEELPSMIDARTYAGGFHSYF